MNPVVNFLASGMLFFVGGGLILAAGVCFAVSQKWRWCKRAAGWFLLPGLAFQLACSTPLSIAFYYVPLLALVIAVPILWSREKCDPRWRWGSLGALVLLVLLGSGLEVRWHITPALSHPDGTRVTVIGDSISAGISDRERPWPIVFEELTGIPTRNLAKAGASLETAMLQAEELTPEDTFVLLEIGGNDFMGETSSSDFEKELRVLLKAVKSEDRAVVMLELPLPPFHNRYGSAQRRVARELGVPLIPKRRFMSVLGAKDATSDGLHLSPTGHRLMAQMVADALGVG
ncbi:SGNH/GDSL hydrolase family protein [bacterium]|nr:SGNH/GDSL hydrolase family protein [bacterium]